MDVSLKRILYAGLAGAWCMLLPNFAYGVNYNFPGPPNSAVAPFDMSPLSPTTPGQGDSLFVNSSTMQLVSTNISQTFTIQLGVNTNVTVAAGAEVSYAGISELGAAIAQSRNDATNSAEIIINNGTISTGADNLYAINLSNSVGATAQNAVFIENKGLIYGDINTQGVGEANLYLNGSATVNGGIRLNAISQSLLSVGDPGKGTSINYATQGTLAAISLIHVFANSSFTLNDTASGITAITVDPSATMTVNATIDGVTSDGAITNNGNLIISEDINKTGYFYTNYNGTNANATTTFTEAVNVTTSGIYGYANSGIHVVQVTDSLNYGYVNFTNTTPSFNIFQITYENGYIPGGTFPLVKAPATVGSPIGFPTSAGSIIVPTGSIFVSFGVPSLGAVDTSTTPNTQQVLITITRTGYQNFAKSYLTKALGSALEGIGGTSTNPDMVALLSAIDATPSKDAVEGVLRQLLPLTSAPLHSFEVQNQGMEQTMLRVAALRTNTYMAGDLSKDNAFWIRPFGNTANQRSKDTTLGYYASSGGLAFGLDRYLDAKFLLGAGGSYSLSHVQDKINPGSQTDGKNYQIMLYGSYNFTKTNYLDWVIGVAANNYKSLRYMNLNNVYTQESTATYSSQQFAIKGTVGKDYAFSDFMQFTPQGSLQYTFAKQYTYTEINGAAANLTVSHDNSDIVQFGIGGKLAVPLALNPGIFIPEIHAMALYNIINGRQNAIFNFADGGDTINAVFIPARSGVKVGVALTVAIANSFEVKFNYDHEVRDRYTNNAYYLNFKYIF